MSFWGLALWFVDVAAPFVASGVIAWLFWKRKLPVWIAIGSVSAAYLVWANIIRWIMVPSASIAILFFTSAGAMSLVHAEIASLDTTKGQIEVTIIPLVLFCALPTALAWIAEHAWRLRRPAQPM